MLKLGGAGDFLNTLEFTVPLNRTVVLDDLFKKFTL
jgi:hypothetical protein